MPAITPALAVEKVLFRLALMNQGVVPIARVFLELPFSLEECEEYADQLVNGHSVRKDEFGEFLAYEFPELQRQMPAVVPDDCPVSGDDRPPAPSEGGVEQRRALLSDAAFRRLRRLAQAEPDETVMNKLASFFKGEEEEDPVKIARTEHEIFHLGLRLGVEEFTYTTIAAQSRMPATQLKECLDRLAARRYIHVGLLPSGDAVAYRFPPELTYPKAHFQRLDDKPVVGGKPDVTLDLDDDDERRPEGAAKKKAKKVLGIKFKKPSLNIKIKPRRRS